MDEIPPRPRWEHLTEGLERDKTLGFKVVPEFRKRVLTSLQAPDLVELIAMHVADPSNFTFDLPKNFKALFV